eukprot:4525153-Lingulodinium_polyedra.AAC.1
MRASREPDREHDFPCRVSDLVNQVGRVPQPGFRDAGQESLSLLHSWELATLLCRRFPGVGVVMEVP